MSQIPTLHIGSTECTVFCWNLAYIFTLVLLQNMQYHGYNAAKSKWRCLIDGDSADTSLLTVQLQVKLIEHLLATIVTYIDLIVNEFQSYTNDGKLREHERNFCYIL